MRHQNRKQIKVRVHLKAETMGKFEAALGARKLMADQNQQT